MIERLDRNLPYLPSPVVSLRTVLAQGKSERVTVDDLDQLSLSSAITEAAAAIRIGFHSRTSAKEQICRTGSR